MKLKSAYIILKEGRSSKRPFVHSSREAAKIEAKRLAKLCPETIFYVCRLENKIIWKNRNPL